MIGEMNLSIAVAGTFCLDEIVGIDGAVSHGPGGLFYSVVPYAQLIRDRGKIYPVARIGSDDKKTILDHLERYDNIDFSRAEYVPGANNRVLLKYYSASERIEQSTHVPDTFTLDDLFPPPDVNLYFVNMIYGREVRHSTLLALRKRLNVPLYLDVHSLFLGFRTSGERYYRKKDWSHWHVSADIVQMNEWEASILGGFLDEDEIDREKSICRFGEYLIDKGASIVIITCGSRGSHIWWKKNKKTLRFSIPAYFMKEAAHPTGCGDAFAAGFIYRFLQSGDPVESGHFASKIAGLKAAVNNSSDMHTFSDILCMRGLT